MTLLTVHVNGRAHLINLEHVQVISAYGKGANALFDFQYTGGAPSTLVADESYADVVRSIAAALGHHAPPPSPISRLGGVS